jgi:hypothetical protein
VRQILEVVQQGTLHLVEGTCLLEDTHLAQLHLLLLDLQENFFIQI